MNLVDFVLQSHDDLRISIFYYMAQQNLEMFWCMDDQIV